MNGLSTRLALACVVIILLTGSAFFLLDRHNSHRYHDALTQRLNASIARYIVDRLALMPGGRPDPTVLRSLADQAMLINPALEVYLLDPRGHIVGHALPADSVVRRSVDVTAIRRLIDGDAVLPIHGDDPRDPAGQKVFSAAPVVVDGTLQGYLYTVLGGQLYEAVSRDLHGDYVESSGTVAAVSIIAASTAVALLVVTMLTRRLSRLARVVGQAAPPDFRVTPMLRRRDGGDEIDRLENLFVSMSDQIERQVRALQETDRLRRDLVTNISHDLRTPLTAMQGYVERLLLKDAELGPRERHLHLETVRRQLLRLDTLVSDLFELAKLQSPDVVPRYEPFALSELAQDIVQDFQLQAAEKRIRLCFDLAPGDTRVSADIALVHRVFDNLVRNAIRFTPVGGEIHLAIAPGTRTVDVTVSDTGPGIAVPELSRVFDRFYRAQQPDRLASGSSGLGLAIVKRILDLHDSPIRVTSPPDRGAVFSFSLPLAATRDDRSRSDGKNTVT